MSERLSKMIWAGEYFGPDGALTLAETEFREKVKSAKALGKNERRAWVGYRHIGAAHSSLSSAYYSASSRIKKKELPEARGQKKVRFARTLTLCALKMCRHSSKAEKILGVSMTADQLNIAASIWVKTRRWKRALQLVERGLKLPARPHTEALLLCNLAEVREHYKDIIGAFESVDKARALLPDVEAERQFSHATRIARHCGEFYLRHAETEEETRRGEMLRAEALAYAEASGSKDQLVKLGIPVGDE